MAIIVSTYFRMITFPHKGRIVATDQITFLASDSNVTRSVPLVGEALHSYHHVGVGSLKDSSLMGTFLLPSPSILSSSPLVAYINMISSSTIVTDPWIVSDETNIKSFGDRMLLSPIEKYYEAIYLACATHNFYSIK